MASNTHSLSKRGRLIAWLDRRFPIQEILDRELTGYYAPKNLSFWYYFGALALLLLIMQFVTGIFLASFYKPGELTAFDSVQYIMREVHWGWFIRYAHSTGASFFFNVVYMHMLRTLL
jgi:ubiquinol-cytochrome c reductase cytochrome b subunit